MYLRVTLLEDLRRPKKIFGENMDFPARIQTSNLLNTSQKQYHLR